MGQDSHFMSHNDILPPNASPEPMMTHHDFGPGGPPRTMAPNGFGHGALSHPPEMGEAW